MNIENIHENRYFLRFSVGKCIVRNLFDMDNFPISRRDEGILAWSDQIVPDPERNRG